jgi:hypothetical protein
MNRLKKIIMVSLTILVAFQFTACNNKQKIKNGESSSKSNIKFSDIMVLSEENNTEKIYRLKDKQLLSSSNIVNVQNINFNINKNIVVYTKKIDNGVNLVKNHIEITNKNKTYDINKDFSYEDLRLSNSGKYVAFRSFSKDDITSAEGLQVYDTNTAKKIDFDQQTLVSGNLYRWDSNDLLLYYGIEISKSGYGNIYSYNFNNSRRNVIFDKFNGYCTFFSQFENGDILYIENDLGQNNMYYYDSKNNTETMIGDNIENVYDYALDNKNNILYIIGKDNSTTGTELFRFNASNKKIDRLTYDFPNIVDQSGGIAVDDSEKVYFCGDSTSYSNKIYMYNNLDSSVNLITNKDDVNYHIISDEK